MIRDAIDCDLILFSFVLHSLRFAFLSKEIWENYTYLFIFNNIFKQKKITPSIDMVSVFSQGEKNQFSFRTGFDNFIIDL